MCIQNLIDSEMCKLPTQVPGLSSRLLILGRKSQDAPKLLTRTHTSSLNLGRDVKESYRTRKWCSTILQSCLERGTEECKEYEGGSQGESEGSKGRKESQESRRGKIMEGVC